MPTIATAITIFAILVPRMACPFSKPRRLRAISVYYQKTPEGESPSACGSI
jgi:hypothetical protein